MKAKRKAERLEARRKAYSEKVPGTKRPGSLKK